MEQCELTIQEIHEGTLVILKEIIKICEELNINYFVAYGTLIGAARHHGFIPWDDDFDIHMLRPEFEKFCAYCEKNAESLKPFSLFSHKTVKGYPYAIPRFCDTRYKMVSDKLNDAGMGMFIDIYPLDGIGDDFFEDVEASVSKIAKRKKKLMTGAEFAAHKKFLPSPHGFARTVIKAFVYAYAKLRGTEYFLNGLDKLAHMYPYEKCGHVGVFVWDVSVFYAEKRQYEGFEYLDFEGIKVKVPLDYEKVLKKSYGDWRKLPPEEKRIATHSYQLYKK